MSRTWYQTPPPDAIPNRLRQLERYNLVMVYLNSLLFSALFTIDTIPAFLVRAVFNGSGIIMVLGLVSLLVGNLAAGIQYPADRFSLFGSYYSTLLLLVLQLLFGVVIALVLAMRHL